MLQRNDTKYKLHASEEEESVPVSPERRRITGRLSWDPSVLDVRSPWRAADDYSATTKVKAMAGHAGSGNLPPVRKRMTEEDEKQLQKILDRYAASQMPSKGKAPSLELRSYQYTTIPQTKELLDLKREEEQEIAAEARAAEVANAPTVLAVTAEEESDEDEEGDSIMTKEQREQFFGEDAITKFYALNHSVHVKTSHFHPLAKTQLLPKLEAPATERVHNDISITPRTKFLSGCLQEKLSPLPVVIRKRGTTIFDFSYQSLGDNFMIQFANSLPDLPFVEELNVRDNRLSDTGLFQVLQAVKEKANLLKLDISMNEIGEHSAGLLREYLTTESCTIETLVLRKADIDDDEAAAFMMAFEKNKSVRHLDLSHNKIGAAENLNVVQPDFTTGGEAIGDMLKTNFTIDCLDLSWNYVRLESAVTIADALRTNYHLTELLLSYNACADEGAMAFGQALGVNATLRTLDLSYNNVGCKGAMVLAHGLKQNTTLRCLRLNGNNLGKDGGQVLMYALTKVGEEACEIEMKGCNLGTLSRDAFNPQQPAGDYVLDCSQPYDQMVATELLRLATYKQGCRFAKLWHEVPASPKPLKTPIQLVKPIRKDISSVNVKFQDLDRDSSGGFDAVELLEVLSMMGMQPTLAQVEQIIAELDADGSGTIEENEFSDCFFKIIFGVVDVDGSKSLNNSELQEALKIAGVEATVEEANRIIAQFDVDNSGQIEEDEFVEFMNLRATEENLKSHEKKHGKQSRDLLDAATNTVWKIPQHGVLVISFEAEKVAKEDTFAGVSEEEDTGMTHLIRHLTKPTLDASERAALFNVALDGSEIEFSATQALELLALTPVHAAIEKVEKIARLVSQMSSVKEAHKLVANYLNMEERMKLQDFMGALYHPVMGSMTQFFSLDMSKEIDRKAAIKIAEVAQAEKLFSKKRAARQDTSQYGNWENFRNATFNGEPLVLSSTFFRVLPQSGTLEFDYVSTTRPKRGTKPLSTRRFDQLMQALREDPLKRSRDSIAEESEMPDKPTSTSQRWSKAGKSISSNVPGFVQVTQDALFLLEATKSNIGKKLRQIQATVANRWLSAQQVEAIVFCMPEQFHARVETARILFSRVIDLEHFVDVYDRLTRAEQKLLLRQLGILNVMTPMNPDRYYELDLSIKEERDMAKILVALAVEEPGENWLDESYAMHRHDPPVPGWELPASWAKEDVGKEGGPRRTGFLTLAYYSGTDKGCAPVWPLRKKLSECVLAGTRLYL